jgi:hypothetical protein
MPEVLPRPALNLYVLVYNLFDFLLDERNAFGELHFGGIELFVFVEITKTLRLSIRTKLLPGVNGDRNSDSRVGRDVTNLRDRSSGKENVQHGPQAEVVEVPVVKKVLKRPLENLRPLRPHGIVVFVPASDVGLGNL